MQSGTMPELCDDGEETLLKVNELLLALDRELLDGEKWLDDLQR